MSGELVIKLGCGTCMPLKISFVKGQDTYDKRQDLVVNFKGFRVKENSPDRLVLVHTGTEGFVRGDQVTLKTKSGFVIMDNTTGGNIVVENVGEPIIQYHDGYDNLRENPRLYPVGIFITDPKFKPYTEQVSTLQANIWIR